MDHHHDHCMVMTNSSRLIFIRNSRVGLAAGFFYGTRTLMLVNISNLVHNRFSVSEAHGLAFSRILLVDGAL